MSELVAIMWTREMPTVPGYYWMRWPNRTERIGELWSNGEWYTMGNDIPHRDSALIGDRVEWWPESISSPPMVSWIRK